jgi:hypothetical protein
VSRAGFAAVVVAQLAAACTRDVDLRRRGDLEVGVDAGPDCSGDNPPDGCRDGGTGDGMARVAETTGSGTK